METLSISEKQYFKELENLQKNPELMPTQDFSDMFLKRIHKGWELANENGYYDDKEDYHSWGYALADNIHLDGEELYRNLSEKQQDKLWGD